MRLTKKTPKEAMLGPADWAGYYYRFTKDEYRELLATSFVVEGLFGFQCLPSRYISVLNVGIANVLERVTQALPSSFLTGEILLAKCHKRL